MKYELYTRMALSEDLPDHGLRRGDVATLVEQHPGRAGKEDGYSLEAAISARPVSFMRKTS